MGATFAKLLVYNANIDLLKQYVGENDILRTGNAPWIGILPSGDEPDCGLIRMQKLAKKLSKESENVSVFLFSYFDDIEFLLCIFRNGKQQAKLDNNGSWSKVGAYVDTILGGGLAKNAFSQSRRCQSLEEQLTLLEETLGVSLFDFPELDERIVPRSSAKADEIKCREQALKNRGNKYKLVATAPGDYPVEFSALMQALEVIKNANLSAGNLLFESGRIANAPDRIAFVSTDYSGLNSIVICDVGSKKLSVTKTRRAVMWAPLWQTRSGAPVMMEFLQAGHPHPVVSCIAPDDSLIWRFAPELDEFQDMGPAHVSQDGIITLYTSISSQTDTLIWRINGETGEVLCSRSVPLSEELASLRYVKALDCFAYYALGTNEMVLLSGDLQERQRWYVGDDTVRFDVASLYTGTKVLLNDGTGKAIDVFDLETGELTRIVLEMRGEVSHVIASGELLSTSESLKNITIYTPDGRTASRHKLKGLFHGCIIEKGRTYIIELRGVSGDDFLNDAAAARAEFVVWLLDEA